MQISCLFDKYRIHKRRLETQPCTLLMLLKTLVKHIEHIIQHLYRSITCYAASNAFLSRFFSAAMMEASASVLCAHIGLQAGTRNRPHQLPPVRSHPFHAALIAPVPHFQGAVPHTWTLRPIWPALGAYSC